MDKRATMACISRAVVPTSECNDQEDRKCATQPFLFPVEHPPWYHCAPKCPNFRKPLVRRAEYDYELSHDFQNDYMHPSKQDKVMPTMAFYFYCDHIPDLPSKHKDKNYQRESKPKLPWPPLAEGECPPPVECDPCGPGPWANPEARKFFYMDCQ